MIKRVALSIAFGAVYYASLLIGGTYSYYSYGTTWDAAFGQALFFGTFFFVVSYPAILAVQFGLAYLIRRMRKIPEKKVSVWEFIPCVLISALWLLPVTDAQPWPEAQFRQCVADKMPPSVSNFQCRQKLSFSGRGWVVSFNVAPEDLDAVLTRFPYE